MRTPDAVDQVRNILDRDRCQTLHSVASELGMNRTTAHQIVKKNLKMSKVAAKFVPRILTPELKQTRVKLCEMNLTMLREDPYLIDKIVTGDESWFAVFDPENKKDSAQWKHQRSNACKRLCAPDLSRRQCSCPSTIAEDQF